MAAESTRRCQRIAFSASEYQCDGSIRLVPYAFTGSVEDGWEIQRDGRLHVTLGPGYRLLRTSHCGVCATDLARQHLPFGLPQITGHEVVAAADVDACVRAPLVVEINASHVGRGLPRSQWCAYCRAGLGTHCPARLVVGIHDVPGGFSPWLLAPVGNVMKVPAAIDPTTATFVEPFAAALHAVTTIDPADGDRIAVLGPRRLGSLIIAALAAWRVRSGRRYEILAITRRVEMAALARALGADDTLEASKAERMHALAEVVVETTASPAGFGLALQLATREVHVKSTTGRPTLGLANLTALVVDEIALVPFRDAEGVIRRVSSPARVAVLLGSDLPAEIADDLRSRGLRVIAGDDPAVLADEMMRDAAVPLGGADLAVVASLEAVDMVIRPRGGAERGRDSQ